MAPRERKYHKLKPPLPIDKEELQRKIKETRAIVEAKPKPRQYIHQIAPDTVLITSRQFL